MLEKFHTPAKCGGTTIILVIQRPKLEHFKLEASLCYTVRRRLQKHSIQSPELLEFWVRYAHLVPRHEY